ncbi:MAG: hypothetical protein RIC29_00285 [Rhodospirillaceae bacterium]
MGDPKAVEAETEYVKDLPGFDKTHPQYFKDPMIDKLLEIVLLLGGEIWTNRDRQMVMEQLLATKGVVTPDLIETFKPDEEFGKNAEEQRLRFVNRIYGCLYPDTEIPEDQNHFKWLTDKKKDPEADD